ncbi:hypothetical protein N7478_001783 [Penicillium angulare]|uniref:uncharacterized protein n=1 Tax=Penicillium angulare TaxID=116970 RepID=UPI00253FEE27|nr:uncharacterized protein N7478_001783 [Penicillium angulare]KAJ5288753.1 hypothetical protein N7478_001783 [Penicillium angulare]
MSNLDQPPPLARLRVPILVPPPTPRFLTPDSVKISLLLSHQKWFEYTDPLTWNQDVLRELVASPEVYEQNSMLVSYKPRPKIDRKVETSTLDLGTLSCLSLEVIQEIMNNMDLLTLERFARTCRYARIIMTCHPTYNFLMKHSPHVRDLLSNTRLLYWHSILNIKAELQFPKCRSCDSTASYLYLPTCERICPTCCNHNKNYWCIDIHDAKVAFALEIIDIKCLPIIRIKPQGNKSRFPGVMNATEWLCPIKCAFESALKRWKTISGLQHAAQEISPDRYDDATALERADARRYRFFRSPVPEVTGDPSLKLKAPRLAAGHSLAQTTATMIPHVERSYDVPSMRYMCKGCLWAYEHKLRPRKDVLEYMGLDPGLDPFEIVRIFERRTHMSRTWPEMVVHFTKCIGAGIPMWMNKCNEEDKVTLQLQHQTQQQQ